LAEDLKKKFSEELSAMSDQRRASTISPHLRTRPATMLTAIGLCVLIMIIQLIPEIQDVSSRFTTASPSTSNAR
jgi:hypothetical protein